MTSFPATLLTIAVPFHKGVDYLRRALETIFAQTGSGWTVLLVDNSTDEREHEGARALADGYPRDRLRYVKNETHLSAADNFNRCIDLAETDLISTVHGDDEVLPCYAREILGIARRHPEAAVLFTAVRIIDRKSEPCFYFADWFKQFLVPRGNGDLVLAGESSLRSILRGDWVNGAAICYRKSLLGDLRWNAAYPMASDLELWSRVILSGRTMAGTRRPPAYSYRRHSGQTTALLSENLHRFSEESQVLETIAERAAAHGWHSAAAVARAKTILQLHLLFLTAQDLAKGSFGRARYKLSALNDIRGLGGQRSPNPDGPPIALQETAVEVDDKRPSERQQRG